MYRSAVAFLGLLFLIVACSGYGATLTPASGSEKPASVGPIVVAADGPNIIPVLVSAETVQGPDRFLFGLTDRQGLRVAAPDVDVRLSFFDDEADPEQVVFEAETRFIWAIEGWNGLYAADVSFPHPGRWATRFDVTLLDGTRESARVRFDVRETTSTPMIGAPAPRVDTPTAADVDGQLRLISTDPEPDPAMYEVSVASALDAGEPFVVTFATPAFCRSATCGPTLEVVKGVAAANPDMRFIHVEPYVMEVDAGSLQPVLSEAGSLQDTPAVEAWGLLTEPFVAVVDGDGLVRAKFEGTVSAAELEDVIASLLPSTDTPPSASP